MQPKGEMNHESNLRSGDIVIGKVVSLEDLGAWVDIGIEKPLHLPLQEISTKEIEDPEEVLQLNLTREFLVFKEDESFYLSIRELDRRIAWKRIRQIQEEDAVVYVKVFEALKNSVLVQIEGLPGVIPNIHISSDRPNEDLIGEILPVKILALDSYYDQIVLSHRWVLLDRNNTNKPYKFGDVVAGKVIELLPDGALLDIGTEKPGYVPLEGLSMLPVQFPEEVLRLDEIREYCISWNYYNSEDENKLYLSISRQERAIAWQRIEQLQEEDAIVYVQVWDINNYGLLVRIEGMNGVIPDLHLCIDRPKQELIGEKLPVKIVTVPTSWYEEIIVSHRWALFREKNKSQQGDRIIDKPYAPKEKAIGKVIELLPNGAWIDIGIEKLVYLHQYEMSICEISSPEEILEVDRIREFLVAPYYDRNNWTIHLSIRALEEEIALERARQIQSENITIYAKVIKVFRNTARVKIDGLEGRIYADRIKCSQPLENLIGQQLPLKIIQIQISSVHNGLMLRYAEVDRQLRQLKIGTIVTGKIRGLKTYGAFVDLEFESQSFYKFPSALLHISLISNLAVKHPEEIFKVGDRIKAKIVDIDIERLRITISTKELENEPGEILKNPQQVFDRFYIDRV
jgi:small subunit ribosomal protein S1